MPNLVELFVEYILPFIMLLLAIIYAALKVQSMGGPGIIVAVFFVLLFGPSLSYALIANDSSGMLFLASLSVALVASGVLALVMYRKPDLYLRQRPNLAGTVLIPAAGGCVCTKSVLSGSTPLKWCVRCEPVDGADNGWRFIGRDDKDIYINTAANNSVVDFNTVANIEPAVLAIYDMPVGTELYIERDGDDIRFFRTGTRDEVKV